MGTVRKGWYPAWKIVQGEDYKSCITKHEKAVVRYRYRRSAVPQKGNGPLCVFRSKRTALNFGISNRTLLRVVVKRSKLRAIWYKDQYGERVIRPLVALPYGTVLCDKVYVVRKVKRK